MALLMCRDVFSADEKGIGHPERQTGLIGILPVLFGKVQFERDRLCHSRTEMKDRIGHAVFADIVLQSVGRHVIQHLEKRDQIAFPRSIGAQTDRHIAQFQLLSGPDGLKS